MSIGFKMKSNNLRYDCCFICVDASLRVLDRYVEQRVDCMMHEGLLNEVYNIYNLNAVYTRGLRQAIGVREFEPLLRTCVVKDMYERERELTEGSSIEKGETLFNHNLMELVRSSSNTESTILLEEAIEKVKLNTRRLVRRQVEMSFVCDFLKQAFLNENLFVRVCKETENVIFSDLSHYRKLPVPLRYFI